MRKIIDLVREPSTWAGLGLIANVLGGGTSGNLVIDLVALIAGGLAVGLRESSNVKLN